ncbi:hypothetical protein D3C72_2415100 [compost metagenome]
MAAFGKRPGPPMPAFSLVSQFVMTAPELASEPVAARVGMVIIGSASVIGSNSFHLLALLPRMYS